MNIHTISFGRLEPKDRLHEEKYPFRSLGFDLPKQVERGFERPPLVAWYNQKDTNACTAFSASWMMSMLNRPEKPKHDGKWPYQKYYAPWLYREACLNDGDPANDPPLDLGGYVWAAFWVLNHMGHVRVVGDKKDAPDTRDGLRSYYWLNTVDQIRTAFSIGRLVVMGTDWEANMMNQYTRPYRNKLEYWIKRGGQVLGGHAYVLRWCSDERQAFLTTGTWGRDFHDCWISYEDIQYLLNRGGECVAGIDLSTIT